MEMCMAALSVTLCIEFVGITVTNISSNGSIRCN